MSTDKSNDPKYAPTSKEAWFTRIKVLILTAIFASIGNFINTWRSGNTIVYPHQLIPAMLMMLAVIILGLLVDEFLRTKVKLSLPSIIYISLLSILAGFPGISPFAEYYGVELGRIALLPLCTPILAYAGISLGKDLPEFRKQGLGIVCTAIMAFAGTYIGSAVIAQILLAALGQI